MWLIILKINRTTNYLTSDWNEKHCRCFKKIFPFALCRSSLVALTIYISKPPPIQFDYKI